jgi:hypothetical protein
VEPGEQAAHRLPRAVFRLRHLPHFAQLRRENPGEGWKCPEVSRGRVKVVKTGRRGYLMQRIRIQYAKTEPLRYTGNLDMHRIWERTLRRARLTIAYSQGFHPQPRLNQACPLPLGHHQPG